MSEPDWLDEPIVVPRPTAITPSDDVTAINTSRPTPALQQQIDNYVAALETAADRHAPKRGTLVWVPEGHSFMTWPTPEPVEPDEEPPSGASSD